MPQEKLLQITVQDWQARDLDGWPEVHHSALFWLSAKLYLAILQLC